MFPQLTALLRGPIGSRIGRISALVQATAVLVLLASLSLHGSVQAAEATEKSAAKDVQSPEKSVEQEKTVAGKASEGPPIEVTFNSFSAAFINVLQNIQEKAQQQRPTPASEKSTLEGFAIRAEDNPEKGKHEKGKRTLDLATEVKFKESSDEDPTASSVENKPALPAPEKVEPSVAGPVRVKASEASPGTKPLADELEQYFDELNIEPPSGNMPEASTSVANDSADSELTTESNEPDTSADEQEAGPSEQKTPNRVPPLEPDVRITQRMAALQPRVAKTLRFYFERPLNTGEDSAWSVMHSMLGYGPRGLVAIGSERGQRKNVVHWMCQNGVCANRRLLYLDKGYIKGLEGPGYQGHPGQFLAMLAQIGIERDFPMNIQGRKLTVDALVNSEMYTCSSSKELTFKLISLSYYLESDTRWKSENGEVWDLPKILSIEMSQPINGAACGGTHRVMAISYAVRNRWIRGEPNEGVYARAEQYVRQYQKYALSLQNRDGSFSSEWFKRPSTSRDRDRLLQTTGHILEWLVYTLPRNELSDPRIVSAVEFLTNLMTRHRYHDWEVGPRGHAIRALSLYHQRVFERRPATPHVANAEIWSDVLR